MLATCDEHGIDYVTDETNFQPEVTLRNAVRCALAGDNISNASVFLIIMSFQMLMKTRIYLTGKCYRN